MMAPLQVAGGVARVIVERESVNDESVVIAKLIARDGNEVRAGEPVLEIETSKSISQVVAPMNGWLALRVSQGDEVAVGGLMFEITSDSQAANGEVRPGPELPTGGAARVGGSGIVAPQSVDDSAAKTAISAVLSDAARRQADSLGIDLSRFAAGIWVTAADVRAAATGAAATAPNNREGGAESLTLERLSKRKQVETRNLVLGNAHGLTSSVAVELELSGQRLVAAPPLFRETIADLVVFEGARLLREFPRLNGCWVDDRHFGTYPGVHFGVSFDSGDNLKVLAVSDADRRSLADVQREITRLLELYESGARIGDELLESATVTLSDLSAAGVSRMQPLLNGRQALILGLTRPVNDHYTLCAAFDHRVTEGLAVSRYLVALAQRVASYFRAAASNDALKCSGCDKSIAEEVDLGGRGFVDVTLPDGTKGMLCRNCFGGY